MQVDVFRQVSRFFPDRIVFAVPNGDFRTWRTGQRLKAEGQKKGVPDLCSPEPIGNWHGLWVELKQPGNYPTDDQIELLLALRKRCYVAHWCDSSEDAVALFRSYYNPK